MNPQLLHQLGLSKSQAQVYLRLVEKGELSPPEVAELTGESRSNAYMILGRLEAFGLVEKLEKSKKISYQALNPIALENLAEQRRQNSAQVEHQIKQTMPQMLSYYYSFTEKPGIRLLQGVEGLKEIYADTLRTRKDIYFWRTPSDTKYLGQDYFDRYKKRRSELGIKTYAYTTDTKSSRIHSKEDNLHKMIRTWISPKDYSAPVEINVYGDKIAYLVFGEDVMGVIIQSPLIAEGMRQIISMAGNNKGRKA